MGMENGLGRFTPKLCRAGDAVPHSIWPMEVASGSHADGGYLPALLLALDARRLDCYQVSLPACCNAPASCDGLPCSRIVDHRHSPADVITGSVMGLIFACLFFVRLLSRVPERQVHSNVRLHTPFTPLVTLEDEDDSIEIQ